MKIKHHPDEEFLLDYATGSLEESWSLAIATHLALCPQCRATLSQIEAIGGNFLDAFSPASSSNNDSFDFDSVFDLEFDNQDKDKTDSQDIQPVLAFPEPLRSYLNSNLNEIKWKRLGLKISQHLIETKDNLITARILRIPAGTTVPDHSHDGTEMTLVLSGAYSDQTGRYGKGDLQIADEETRHQPCAELGSECICLVVTDAPLQFKNLSAKIAQPFFGI